MRFHRGRPDADPPPHRPEPADKPLLVLHGGIKTPPIPAAARVTAGHLLRRVQQGVSLGMPDSRPMPAIGPNCHELRVDDAASGTEWRVIYMIDDIAIIVLDVFRKTTQATPEPVKQTCRARLQRYLAAKKGH